MLWLARLMWVMLTPWSAHSVDFLAQMAIASCVTKLRKLVVRVVEIGGM